MYYFLPEASIAELPTIEKLKDEVARRDETINIQQREHALLVNELTWRISALEKENKGDPKVMSIPKKSEVVL